MMKVMLNKNVEIYRIKSNHARRLQRQQQNNLLFLRHLHGLCGTGAGVVVVVVVISETTQHKSNYWSSKT